VCCAAADAPGLPDTLATGHPDAFAAADAEVDRRVSVGASQRQET
jgi:hypothetical protein